MPSTRHRILCVAAAALVAFASAVEAKGKGKSKSKKPKIDDEGGSSSDCYDDQGNQVPCPISTTVWVVIGVVGALVLLSLILCCVFRKKLKNRVWKKKDTKGVHHKVPTAEAALPLYHHKEAGMRDSYQKPQGEKLQHAYGYSTPYDPVYPPQQYGHRHSPSATSSVYNVPAVTPTQPQDYSYQHHYNANVTAQHGSYAPPPPPHY